MLLRGCRCCACLRHTTLLKPNAAEAAAIAHALHTDYAHHYAAQSQPHQPMHFAGARICEPAAGDAGAIGAEVESALRRAMPDVACILQAGCGAVLLSLGEHGAALCMHTGGYQWLQYQQQSVDGRADRSAEGHADLQQQCDIQVLLAAASVVSLVNVNGAGDCLLAGFLAEMSKGCKAAAALDIGIAAAAFACASDRNVPESLRTLSHNRCQAHQGVRSGQQSHRLVWQAGNNAFEIIT